MKIRPVGAELFHVDRRTDITKLIAAFRNFSNAPNNSLSYLLGKITYSYLNIENLPIFQLNIYRIPSPKQPYIRSVTNRTP